MVAVEFGPSETTGYARNVLNSTCRNHGSAGYSCCVRNRCAKLPLRKTKCSSFISCPLLNTTDSFIDVNYTRAQAGLCSSACLMSFLRRMILIASVACAACCLPHLCFNAAKALGGIQTTANGGHSQNGCAIIATQHDWGTAACLSEVCSMQGAEPAKYDRTRRFAVISETDLPQRWGYGPHGTPVASGPTLLMLGVLLRP